MGYNNKDFDNTELERMDEQQNNQKKDKSKKRIKMLVATGASILVLGFAGMVSLEVLEYKMEERILDKLSTIQMNQIAEEEKQEVVEDTIVDESEKVAKDTTTQEQAQNNTATQQQTQTTQEPELISAGEAKQIALNHAGVSASQVWELEVDLDRDMMYTGVQYVYEVDFSYNGYDYEYDIDATNKKILYSSKERDV